MDIYRYYNILLWAPFMNRGTGGRVHTINAPILLVAKRLHATDSATELVKALVLTEVTSHYLCGLRIRTVVINP